jgi:hypothetical protein
MCRVARTEIARLQRRRATISTRRDGFAAKLEDLEGQLEAIDARADVLRGLTGDTFPPAPAAPAAGSCVAVRGAALRTAAANVLWRRHQDAPIHYRDWYELVLASGFALTARDPLAAFLTNVRDSPAVRHAGTRGAYRLDPDTLVRRRITASALARELARLEQDVGEMLRANAPPGRLAQGAGGPQPDRRGVAHASSAACRARGGLLPRADPVSAPAWPPTGPDRDRRRRERYLDLLEAGVDGDDAAQIAEEDQLTADLDEYIAAHNQLGGA